MASHSNVKGSRYQTAEEVAVELTLRLKLNQMLKPKQGQRSRLQVIEGEGSRMRILKQQRRKKLQRWKKSLKE